MIVTRTPYCHQTPDVRRSGNCGTGSSALREIVCTCRGALAELVNGHAHTVDRRTEGTVEQTCCVRRDLRAEYEREASRCGMDGERRDWSGDDRGEHAFAHVGAQAICPPVEVALVEFGMGRVVSHFETASPDQIHDL